jgi:hypothetical protein
MIVLPKVLFAASLELIAILFLLLRSREKFFSHCKRRVSEFVRRNGSWSFGSFVFFTFLVAPCEWSLSTYQYVCMYVCWRPPPFRPGIFSLSLPLSLYLVGHLDGCIYPPVISPTFACLTFRVTAFFFLGGEFWTNNRERERGRGNLN